MEKKLRFSSGTGLSCAARFNPRSGYRRFAAASCPPERPVTIAFGPRALAPRELEPCETVPPEPWPPPDECCAQIADEISRTAARERPESRIEHLPPRRDRGGILIVRRVQSKHT